MVIEDGMMVTFEKGVLMTGRGHVGGSGVQVFCFLICLHVKLHPAVHVWFLHF